MKRFSRQHLKLIQLSLSLAFFCSAAISAAQSAAVGASLNPQPFHDLTVAGNALGARSQSVIQVTLSGQDLLHNNVPIQLVASTDGSSVVQQSVGNGFQAVSASGTNGGCPSASLTAVDSGADPSRCWAPLAWALPLLTLSQTNVNTTTTAVNTMQVQGGKNYLVLKLTKKPSVSVSDSTVQRLTEEDLWLDPMTMLPVKLLFQQIDKKTLKAAHSIEVDYTGMQTLNGLTVPRRIQRKVDGNLVLDIGVTSLSTQ